MREQDIRLNRSTIGVLFGFIGFAGLLLAVVAFAWYLRPSAVVVVSLALSLVGFVAWAAIAPRAFRATLTGKQAQFSTGATFATLLLVGIVMLVYIIIARLNLAVDTTLGQNFSLSTASERVLDRIPAGSTVQITGFYSSDALEQRALDDQFYRQYTVQTDGQIVVEYIDPQQQPAVAQRFGVREDGQTFISLLDEQGNVDFDTLTLVNRQGKQERDVTTAIARMLNEQVYQVYFAESFESLSIFDETERGLTLLDNTLRFNGIQTQTLDLSELARDSQFIPENAAVLVLPRPLAALPNDQAQLVTAYLEQGGRLLALADLTYVSGEFDEFLVPDSPLGTYLLENYGLGAREAAIVEPVANLGSPLEILSYATFTENPIGAGIPPDGDTFFSIARPLIVSEERPGSVANGRIIATSPQSYAETNIDALSGQNEYRFDENADIAGPLDVVVWAESVRESGGNGSRVVLIGDGNFAMNENIDSGAIGNAALFTGSIEWLSGREETIEFGFAADPSAVPTLFVSGNQLDLIGIVTVVLVPLGVLLMGVGVWYRRTFR